jgi:general secretion pathway protein D
VRSVQTQLSVYNGATVVMGGLITEDRKTMEDKIPFLGDIPYLGRLFRSRSEQSIKRNLLVFVTARLVDPAGRVVKTGGESALLAAGASSTPSAPVAAPVAAQEGGAEPNAAAIQ